MKLEIVGYKGFQECEVDVIRTNDRFNFKFIDTGKHYEFNNGILYDKIQHFLLFKRKNQAKGWDVITLFKHKFEI